MNKLISTCSTVILLSAINHSVFATEMIQGRPSKKYTVMSPISSDARKIEKAYQLLQKKGEKIGADAVIDWECAPPIKSGGLLGDGLFTTKTKAVCNGIAIKWK